MSLRFPLAAAAALALGTLTQAQIQTVSQLPANLGKITGPVVQLPTYVFNVDTRKGYFETGPTKIVGTQRALTGCYLNSTFAGSFGTPTMGDEWVDWGDKTCGLTGQIGGFTVGYATTALDPSIGGPGASLDIALYQGTSGGGSGFLGTEIMRFPFTGLAGSSDGSPAGFTIPVSLVGSEIPICDGDIGWGYFSVDGLTGPLLISTTGTCFATPDPTTGTEDCFDIFTGPAPTGVYAGTFSFMTAGIASFWLELRENDGASSTSSVINGTGVNPVKFSESATPLLSQPWVTSIDLSTNPTALATAIVFTDDALVSPVTIVAGELLVDITSPSWLFTDINVTTPGSHTNVVPKDATLLGNQLFTQGAIFDPSAGGLILLNGIEFTMGL